MDLAVQTEHIGVLYKIEEGTRYVSWESNYGAEGPVVEDVEGEFNHAAWEPGWGFEGEGW